MKFPENLQNALSACRKTQQELANHLGVTQSTVSRWLNGKCEPDFKTLWEICVFLEETPDSLLGYDEYTANKNS